jgi:hypothetical protein
MPCRQTFAGTGEVYIQDPLLLRWSFIAWTIQHILVPPMSQIVESESGYHAVGAIMVAPDRSIMMAGEQFNRDIMACVVETGKNLSCPKIHHHVMPLHGRSHF